MYRMSVLPEITHSILRDVYNAVEKFIWNGKKPKISLSILQKEKQFGGLGLVNLEIKHKALNVKWVQTMARNDKIKNLAKQFLNMDKIFEIMWNCNLSINDARKINLNTGFWPNVFLAWCEYNFKKVNNNAEPWNEIIWLNSCIKVGNNVIHPTLGLPMYWRVKDILNSNDEVMSYQEFKAKYQLCNWNWMNYETLISAIPKSWKKNPAMSITEVQPELGLDKLSKTLNLSRKVYKQLNSDESAITKTSQVWEKFEGFCNERHRMGFKNIYKCTTIVKLRNFQYRLLHNKIFCNNVLFYWKIKETQRCDFCDYPKQDIQHLLYECNIVRKIWSELMHYFKTLKIDCIEINFLNIIYNTVHPKSKHIVNFIVLLTKFVIFRCKCEGTYPNIDKVFNEIMLTHSIESAIASKNNKMTQHCSKWSPVYLSDIEYED